MTKTDPYALAVTLYEERLKNDAWALRELMHEKATWEIVGFGGSDEPSRAGGSPSAMAAFIDEVLATWRWVEHDFIDIVADDARLFCRYRLAVEFIPTGRVFQSQGAEFFRIEDGFIREIISYADPRLLQLAQEN